MIEIGISPVAFSIGEFSVRWYGIMVALAVLTVVLWTLREVKREARLSYDTVINAALVGIPSGIIFSRLLHVIDLWEYYGQHLDQIVGGSGLTIYGAVLGATLGVWVYSKIAKIQFGYLSDMIAPGILLAQMVGRVGCILNGCCYGVETTAFCAVVYTNPDSLAPIGIPVHPTQIYEIIYLLIAFAVVIGLRGRLKPDGSLFLVYLSLYSIWRFGIGFIRDGTSLIFGLHEAQVIGLIVLVIAVPIMVMRTRWVKRGEDSNGKEEEQ